MPIDAIRRLLRASANVESASLWRRASQDVALYGVSIKCSNGRSAFCGMVRYDGQTDSAAFQNLLANLIFMAAMKCQQIWHELPTRPRDARCHWYFSVLSHLDDAHLIGQHPSRLLKVSLDTLDLAYGRHSPVALDLRGQSVSLGQIRQIATRVGRLAWIEDPPPDIPIANLSSHSRAIAFGETCRTAAELYAAQKQLDTATALIYNLELSKLGPRELVGAARRGHREGVQVVLHGHLPFDMALLTHLLPARSMIEINVPYLRQRNGYQDRRLGLHEQLELVDAISTDPRLAGPVMSKVAPEDCLCLGDLPLDARA